MKKLFQILATAYLLAPCLTWAVNPFQSDDAAKKPLKKRRLANQTQNPLSMPMPPYDYDSGPIVQQRSGLVTPTFNPEATRKLQQFLKKIDAAAEDTGTNTGVTIDGQPVSFTKILDEAREHVKAGADFTRDQNFDIGWSEGAIKHNHASLLKALLKRGQVLHTSDFSDFSEKPHNIQQLLLSGCVEATDPNTEENVLHKAFIQEPKDVYEFCRYGVDATKSNVKKGNRPLHALMESTNEELRRTHVLLRQTIELETLEKVAAFTWKYARLSDKNYDGKTSLDLLTGGAIGFRQDVELIAKATHQEGQEYASAQQATSLLLGQHTLPALAQLVIGYAQPTWLHDIWPKIKENAGMAK